MVLQKASATEPTKSETAAAAAKQSSTTSIQTSKKRPATPSEEGSEAKKRPAIESKTETTAESSQSAGEKAVGEEKASDSPLFPKLPSTLRVGGQAREDLAHRCPRQGNDR